MDEMDRICLTALDIAEIKKQERADAIKDVLDEIKPAYWDSCECIYCNSMRRLIKKITALSSPENSISKAKGVRNIDASGDKTQDTTHKNGAKT